jgi:hypothetical protein
MNDEFEIAVKRSWFILRYHHSICLKAVGKPMVVLGQDRKLSDQKMKLKLEISKREFPALNFET